MLRDASGASSILPAASSSPLSVPFLPDLHRRNSTIRLPSVPPQCASLLGCTGLCAGNPLGASALSATRRGLTVTTQASPDPTVPPAPRSQGRAFTAPISSLAAGFPGPLSAIHTSARHWRCSAPLSKVEGTGLVAPRDRAPHFQIIYRSELVVAIAYTVHVMILGLRSAWRLVARRERGAAPRRLRSRRPGSRSGPHDGAPAPRATFRPTGSRLAAWSCRLPHRLGAAHLPAKRVRLSKAISRRPLLILSGFVCG